MTHYANGINYVFEKEEDGWISIYEVWQGRKKPLIQTKNYARGRRRKNGVDRCIACGEMVPEGRQVCPYCEVMQFDGFFGLIKKRKQNKKNRCDKK